MYIPTSQNPLSNMVISLVFVLPATIILISRASTVYSLGKIALIITSLSSPTLANSQYSTKKSMLPETLTMMRSSDIRKHGLTIVRSQIVLLAKCVLLLLLLLMYGILAMITPLSLFSLTVGYVKISPTLTGYLLCLLVWLISYSLIST